MNCDETRIRIGDLIDGALSPAEASSVEKHIAGCAACRAELAELRRALAAVAGLPGKHAPLGFAAGVTEQIQWNDRIAAYADGALAPNEIAAVEQHLAAHADAREELADLRKTAEALRTLPKLKAPAGFAFRVMAEIRPAAEERRDNVIPMSRATVWLRIVGSVAAILLIYVGMSNLPERKPQTDSTTAAKPPVTGTEDRLKGSASTEELAKKNKDVAKESPNGYTLPDGTTWKAGSNEPANPGDNNENSGNKDGGLGRPMGGGTPKPEGQTYPPAGAGKLAKANAGGAVHRISVASQDIAVDSQRVRGLLSDAGFTWSAQGGDRVVMVKVSAARAKEIMASLEGATADKLEERDAIRKDTDDERYRRELEKTVKEDTKAGRPSHDATVALASVDRLELALTGQVEKSMLLLAQASKLRERAREANNGAADRGPAKGGDNLAADETAVAHNESGAPRGADPGRSKKQGHEEGEESKSYGAGGRTGAGTGHELAESKDKHGDMPPAAPVKAAGAGAGMSGGSEPAPAEKDSPPATADPSTKKLEGKESDKHLRDELKRDGKSPALGKADQGDAEDGQEQVDLGEDEGVVLVIEFADLPAIAPAAKPGK